MVTPRTRRPRATTWDAAVGDFMAYLEKRERSSYTRRNYRDDLRDFALWWENEGNPAEPLLPVSVSEEDLLGWKLFLRNEEIEKRLDEDGKRIIGKREAGSVNVKLASLKSFLRWAHRRGIIAALPEMPRQVASEARGVKALDAGQQRQLLRAARAHRNPQAWPLVFIMIETGLRLAELVALRRRDLDIRKGEGTLRVREGKGCKSRTLPLSNPEVRRAFKILLADGTDPDDPVFKSQRERIDRKTKRPTRALTGRGVQEVLERLRSKALEWPELHPHMLRHTFGKNLRAAGVDWPTVAKLMGHSSIVTTMTHYGTPSEKDLAKAMNRHGQSEDD